MVAAAVTAEPSAASCLPGGNGELPINQNKAYPTLSAVINDGVDMTPSSCQLQLLIK